MRIAVTYENGNIFQHFGHTEEFKIYEVENGSVVSSEIVGSNGVGHGALAGLLEGKKIDVLICGGIGGGAQAALAEHGIELCAGASGNADQAVEAYLRGELVNTGANCDHHSGEHSCGEHGDDHCGHHDEGHCGSHDGDHCGHHGGDHCGDDEGDHCAHHDGDHCGDDDGEHCGHHNDGHCGCHGGCHEDSGIQGPNVGKTCRTHYRGTFNDGTQFDSSYDRGEPLEFVCGAGMMIRGFDAAVANMKVGEKVNVHLMPSEAYGEADPAAIFTVEIAQIPGSENLTAGQRVYLQNQFGQPFPVTVMARTDTTITFDANHEMAGKELNFLIELVEVV